MDHRLSQRHRSAEEAPDVSVIVPTYREADNLGPLVRRITDTLGGAWLFEIIIVDDNSKDGTAEMVGELSDAGHPVRLIVRVGQRGLSSAVLRGFGEARGDVLVCMDADLSHPPEAIGQLVECLADPGVDMAIGSRYVDGAGIDQNWSALRRFNSRFATLLARPFSAVKDPLAGFFAIPREVFARAERLRPIGYKIGLELMVKCACKEIREVPIHFFERRSGQSKLNVPDQISYIRHLIRLAGYKYGKFFPAKVIFADESAAGSAEYANFKQIIDQKQGFAVTVGNPGRRVCPEVLRPGA